MTLNEHASLPLHFKDFENRYNYSPEYNYNLPLFRIVMTLLSNSEQPMTVLDIGCGTGIGRDREMQREISSLSGRYWGVEPDTEVDLEEGLFDRVIPAMLEDSDITPNSVDVAYCFMVMEHVQDPTAFMEKIAKVLKPGGVFVFGTPNRNSFFGIVCYWSEKLKISDVIQSLLYRDESAAHHYPLAYKINSESQVHEHATSVGLKARVAYSESPRTLSSYFKGPLSLFRQLIVFKRRLVKKPHSLCHLYGYIEKPIETK